MGVAIAGSTHGAVAGSSPAAFAAGGYAALPAYHAVAQYLRAVG